MRFGQFVKWYMLAGLVVVPAYYWITTERNPGKNEIQRVVLWELAENEVRDEIKNNSKPNPKQRSSVKVRSTECFTGGGARSVATCQANLKINFNGSTARTTKTVTLFREGNEWTSNVGTMIDKIGLSPKDYKRHIYADIHRREAEDFYSAAYDEVKDTSGRIFYAAGELIRGKYTPEKDLAFLKSEKDSAPQELYQLIFKKFNSDWKMTVGERVSKAHIIKNKHEKLHLEVSRIIGESSYHKDFQDVEKVAAKARSITQTTRREADLVRQIELEKSMLKKMDENIRIIAARACNRSNENSEDCTIKEIEIYKENSSNWRGQLAALERVEKQYGDLMEDRRKEVERHNMKVTTSNEKGMEIIEVLSKYGY